MLRGPPGVATPGAFLFRGSIVNRTVFLVDGFNLHHSVLDSERLLGCRLRRLDVASLCAAYVHALPGRNTLERIVHYSALPHHLEAAQPGVIHRRQAYLEALRATGVETRLGQFKRRQRTCPFCGHRFATFEEKETDVAIGATMTRLVCDDACDTVVLVTGDTDLVPAFRAARDRDPSKTLAVMFPYRRANAELKAVADVALSIKATTYTRHQLPVA
jgi:uncharacterized LabA/DUF88 family protein